MPVGGETLDNETSPPWDGRRVATEAREVLAGAAGGDRVRSQLFAAKQAYHDRFKCSLEEDVATTSPARSLVAREVEEAS
jgi:hypothetical protein